MNGNQNESHERSFACAMAYLSADDAQKILEWSEGRFEKSDLYHGEHGADSYGPTYGLEVEPHVTILYGLHEDNPAPVRAALKGLGKVLLNFDEVSLFENEDKPYDVVKLAVTTPELVAAHEKLSKLPCTKSYPVYNPHLTLAYVVKGAGRKYVGPGPLSTAWADRVVFSTPGKDKTTWRLDECAVKPMKRAAKILHGLVEGARFDKWEPLTFTAAVDLERDEDPDGALARALKNMETDPLYYRKLHRFNAVPQKTKVSGQRGTPSARLSQRG